MKISLVAFRLNTVNDMFLTHLRELSSGMRIETIAPADDLGLPVQKEYSTQSKQIETQQIGECFTLKSSQIIARYVRKAIKKLNEKQEVSVKK